MRQPGPFRPSGTAFAAAFLLPSAALAQTLTLEPTMREVREGVTRDVQLLLKLDAPAKQAFRGEIRLAGAGATAGTDFAPTVLPFTFMKGEVVKTASFTIIDDGEDEPYREQLVPSVAALSPLDTTQVPGVINAAAMGPIAILDNDNEYTVSASGGEEGGAVTVTVRQAFDSEIPAMVSAVPGGGSATPGADFAPWRVQGTLPSGTTETTLTIPLAEDDEVEGTESFPIALVDHGPGTAFFEPSQVTGSITDTTRPAEPVRIEYTEGVVKMDVRGMLIEQPFQHQSMQGTLRKHRGGDRMTLSQSNGKDLELRRYCAQDTDFGAIAADLPGLSAAEIGGDRDTGWRGAFTVDDINFDYAMVERPDGTYAGYGRQQGNVDGADVLTVHGFRVIPLSDPEPEVPRLPADPPETQVPLDDAADAVARELAEELGMSPEALRPYISATPGADGTRGDGASARAVEVEIWLDGEGRPLPADRTAPGPCDPNYGKAEPAVSRLRYRFHDTGDGIVAQGAVEDVESGRLESAFMEDFDTATDSLDTAAQRAHDGLSPGLSAPQ